MMLHLFFRSFTHYQKEKQHQVQYKFYKMHVDRLSTQAELGFQHSPYQHLGIDLPRDAEQRDLPVV